MLAVIGSCKPFICNIRVMNVISVSSVSNYTLHPGTCVGAAIATTRLHIHECAEACDAHALCTAFVYDSRVYCFLKRRRCAALIPSLSQRLYVRKTNKGSFSYGNSSLDYGRPTTTTVAILASFLYNDICLLFRNRQQL